MTMLKWIGSMGLSLGLGAFANGSLAQELPPAPPALVELETHCQPSPEEEEQKYNGKECYFWTVCVRDKKGRILFCYEKKRCVPPSRRYRIPSPIRRRPPSNKPFYPTDGQRDSFLPQWNAGEDVFVEIPYGLTFEEWRAHLDFEGKDPQG